jgi:hypothetical protein
VLDEILRKELAKTNVKYVSMRGDGGMCPAKFLEPDGVHPTAKGYRAMWAMIENAGGAVTAVASAAQPQKPADTAVTTASIAGKPVQARVADAGAAHRLVMDIHVPGSPSEPLVWTRNQD